MLRPTRRETSSSNLNQPTISGRASHKAGTPCCTPSHSAVPAEEARTGFSEFDIYSLLIARNPESATNLTMNDIWWFCSLVLLPLVCRRNVTTLSAPRSFPRACGKQPMVSVRLTQLVGGNKTHGHNYFCGGLWAKLTPFVMLPLRPSVHLARRAFSFSVMPSRGLMAFSAPLGYSRQYDSHQL